MFSPLKYLAFVFLAGVLGAHAESHTVHFDNRCGRGTPTLIQGPNVLSSGADYTSNGPLISAIAYLQTGNCLFNGEGCTLIETTLVNPTSPGSGSSTDISLIPPHAFSVTSGFAYFNGCDGQGADCTGANCPTAFHVDTDTQVQVQCQVDNVDLVITFCD
ncbi:glycopeptide [Flammula alnicola]|nr:glycopeptide [Flammula alnicola]